MIVHFRIIQSWLRIVINFVNLIVEISRIVQMLIVCLNVEYRLDFCPCINAEFFPDRVSHLLPHWCGGTCVCLFAGHTILS